MSGKRFFKRLIRYRWWFLAAGALLLAAVYVLDDRPDPYAEARRAMRRAAAVMALEEGATMPNTREATRRPGNPAGSSYLPYWALENDTNTTGQATSDGLQTATRGQGKGNRSNYDSPTTDSAPFNPSAARTGGRGNGGAGGVDNLEHGRRVRTLGVPGR